MSTETEYTLAELAALTGVTPRTVRYYISVGLLPAPSQAGRATRYTEDHLQRVRVIRKLQEEHLPLAQIREQLDGLDAADVASVLQAPTSSRPTNSALDYVRALQASVGAPAHLIAERPALSLGPPPGASAIGIPPPRPRPTATRSQWEHIPITPDVEIHIRRPLDRTEQKRVERLITVAREILEDPS